MLKKWFTLPSIEEMAPQPKPVESGATRPSSPSEDTPAAPRAPAAAAAAPASGVPKYGPFEHIYQSAAVKPPRLSYGILKVAEMMNSPHLSGMSPEARRCSLLMALEAAGVEIEDLLQDAVVRQRALNDYEEGQGSRLHAFEQSKLDENRKIQQELDRLTAQYMGRIQANLDEVAKEEENFREWQRSKQQESQRITEAAAYCVPQGSAAGMSSLTAVLERATVAHR
ncbi:MAG TPA: hypothetical protein VKT49_10575 [Bryobacteraceae bacterium]|nr:hypothetical protein [Bryobacteraceae bacterium]